MVEAVDPPAWAVMHARIKSVGVDPAATGTSGRSMRESRESRVRPLKGGREGDAR